MRYNNFVWIVKAKETIYALSGGRDYRELKELAVRRNVRGLAK